MTILREQDLDCQSHGCKFARAKTGMRTNGRCTCVDKLISEIAAQRATIEELSSHLKSAESAFLEYEKCIKALREALQDIKKIAFMAGIQQKHPAIKEMGMKAQAALQEEL